VSAALEAMEGPPPSDRTVGRRCDVEHRDVGRCNRKAGHDLPPDPDPWHHSVTGIGDDGNGGQHWRWTA
jgi:hypothetical protein